MKKKKTLFVIFLLIAVLLLGIGYAVVSNITLKISGTATASANADNFKVYFTSSKNTTNATDTTSDYTSKPTTVSFDTSGLSAYGDTATITYTITNAIDDLSADVAVPTVEITGTNSDYFSATTDWGNATKNIAAGGTQDVTVTVKLEKTPIDEDKTATVTVTTTASPVQPTHP